MPRKSYGDLKRQISALIAEQRALEEKATSVLAESIMATDAGKQLASLSNTELQAVARKIAASIGDMINQVRVERTAKAARKIRNAVPKQEPTTVPDSPAPKAEPPAQSKVLQPPPQKILPGAVPRAEGLEYRA